MDRLDSMSQVYPPVSNLSSTSESEGSIQQVRFVTGSTWIGLYDKLGMHGSGVYQLPNGVEYHGNMSRGVCEGLGMLRFPNGGTLDGVWEGGKLKFSRYLFADNLMYSGMDWKYCKMPDRRFFLEQTDGLRPAPSEQLTGEDVARVVAPDMYDVGDGLYSTKTKCVTDPVTGEILRIPSASEEQWIVEHARTAELKNVGFCPQFYENLFGEEASNVEERVTPSATGEELNKDKDLLRMVQQEGWELEPQSRANILDLSYNLRQREPKRELTPWSKKSLEEMLLLSDIIKHMEMKRDSGTSFNESPEQPFEDEEFSKMLREAGFKVSGPIEHLLQASAKQPPEPADTTVAIQPVFGTKNSLEVFRELKKLLTFSPSQMTMPFTISSSDFLPSDVPSKMTATTYTATLSSATARGSSERTFGNLTAEDSSYVFSDYIDSKENLNIDYLEFESSHDF